jgi:hypothetical protein
VERRAPRIRSGPICRHKSSDPAQLEGSSIRVEPSESPRKRMVSRKAVVPSASRTGFIR